MLSDTRRDLGTTARDLLTAAAVRARANLMLEEGLAGRLTHFDVRPERLPATAAYVAETIRLNYPALEVPPHARWRHFVIDGVDRWTEIANRIEADQVERARIRIGLVVISVLLDAGAGPSWRWRDPRTGRTLARSEGLAVASLEAFASGLFSSDPARPYRVDAEQLTRLTLNELAAAFQVNVANPLEGLEGRLALLHRLGATAAADQMSFGADGRIGNLYDRLAREASARGGDLPAPLILTTLLDALGPIWPGRLTLGGLPLGDTWHHPAIAVPGETDGLIPFHKLSQWLAYSMIEPLQEAGLEVSEIDGLTGLAEYRNGGLFLDFGVLEARQRDLLSTPLKPSDEHVVEWRALTVALLDRVAPLVRAELGLSEHALPLASVLEGGTWAAGRRIARERREGGTPPVTLISDGSIF